jgi:16S rRNA (cytosine967-C5)-methyltransferase
VIAPARLAAFDVVRRVFEDGAYADRAFRSAAQGLDDRDRNLAQRLAYGTIQMARPIDHAIDAFARGPVDPPVRAALRLGAYQLGWLDQVPAHAVVSDSVELVRASYKERAVPFANAVMRKLAGGIRDVLAALPEGPLLHSYPDWVAEVWERDLGHEGALALMRAQNEPLELVVRGDVPGEPTDVPGAVRVDHIDPAWIEQGRAWPMSRGSQLAALMLGEGGRVLDLCAAPGGKTAMLRGDEVVAVELNQGRARELEENLRRLGRTDVRIVHGDARELAESGFDRALVDAPCSGLGVLGRRPDLRWRARPLPELQLELLRAAAERVRPGGTIVYSVCTINADENEAVVDASGLGVDPLGEEWPAYRHPRRPEFLLTLPHLHRTSGFFVARLAV